MVQIITTFSDTEILALANLAQVQGRDIHEVVQELVRQNLKDMDLLPHGKLPPDEYLRRIGNDMLPGLNDNL